MSCKVGNQTNSQDPQAVNSRVFVGNLNTFQCSKTDVERIFQRYGRIAGISMHKGYAFIQFTNPFDARSACLGEDGRLLWGQTLDVNMVAEPKAHQTGRKRQNIAKTGNDWDYYYDSLKLQLESLYRSYYAQVGFPGPRLVPPMKRARLHVPQNPPKQQSVAKQQQQQQSPIQPKSHPACSNNNSLGDLKTYSTPDILICGNCRELFSEVEQLLDHKKNYCKLRFTCKCHTISGKQPGEEPAALLCSQCKDSFHSAWDLMVHVQAAHMLNIYQLSVDPNNSNSSTPRDHSEGGKDGGESGGSSSSNGGTPMERGSPNGFNANGTLINDNLMEDSHCQTDLSLSTHLPNHRPEISGSILDSRVSSTATSMMVCGSSISSSHHHHQQHQHQHQHHSVSTGTSTSTSTNENGQLSSSQYTNALSEMISLRNSNLSQGQKVVGEQQQVNICDVINASSPIINGNNGLCMGGGVIFVGGTSGCNNNNNNNIANINNNNNQPSFMGQVNNSNSSHSISPTFYSQPMEASTQTSNSDSLPCSSTILPSSSTTTSTITSSSSPASAAALLVTNGPSVINSSSTTTNNTNSTTSTTGSFSEELCGIASSIKTETSVHLPLVNGQVAGI